MWLSPRRYPRFLTTPDDAPVAPPFAAPVDDVGGVVRFSGVVGPPLPVGALVGVIENGFCVGLYDGETWRWVGLAVG